MCQGLAGQTDFFGFSLSYNERVLLGIRKPVDFIFIFNSSSNINYKYDMGHVTKVL